MPRKIALSFLALLFFAATGSLRGQQAHVNLDWDPQRNTDGLVPFAASVISPEVQDDGMVTFRLRAPGAREVAVVGLPLLSVLGSGLESVPMKSGPDSLWSVTIGPVPQNIYRYALRIDGVDVVDPNNTISGFGDQPAYSLLVVPGEGPAYYDARPVPHGTVTRHIYHSDVTGGERELYVYTPPGYGESTLSYPALYLLGGSGELASNWALDGRANLIMDNLLAEGAAVPMVIVMPNNQMLHRMDPRHQDLTFDLFADELRREIIPLVEESYSLRPDARGRALAGLSMGGRHTQFVGFRSLDLFASFGVLSAGHVDTDSLSAPFLTDPEVNEKVDYLFVGQGDLEDAPGNRTRALHEALLGHGVEHEYYVGGGGGHDWATWRHLLYARFLPGLWRG